MTTAEPVRSHTVRDIDVPVHALSRLETVVGIDRYRAFRTVAAATRRLLDGAIVWNVSSTAEGGGVAEMLQVLVGYSLDAGIDIRWLVMAGDAEFFGITKRLHNRLHGVPGDDGRLGDGEAAHYAAVADENAAGLVDRVRPGDIVLLHDPQTAGLASSLAATGAHVIWRCHVGREGTNEFTDEAWSFLRPHLDACEAYAFSVRSYVPAWMDPARTRVIPPSIDPLSPKNQAMDRDSVGRIVRTIGLFAPVTGDPPATFTRRDGTEGTVGRRAQILADGSSSLRPGTPLVVQVSRWDRLKDMAGVMRGFATSVVGRADGHLALVGPHFGEVSDDPEGAQVYAECVRDWEALPPRARRHVTLVTLPMDDPDENAAMVNAIQRHATVIVQKSLVEGFGLTVSEGMWKAKPVVATNVGGIASQIAPGTGVLLDDPTDLAAFGDAVAGLLGDPESAERIGRRAHRRVFDHFLIDVHLSAYARLFAEIVP